MGIKQDTIIMEPIPVSIEMENFFNELKRLSSEIIEVMRPYAIERFSKETEPYRNGDERGYRPCYREIVGIHIDVLLRKNMAFNFKEAVSIKESYSLWSYTDAVNFNGDKVGISGGLDFALWNCIKDKINFDLFPNFEKPEFSTSL